MAAKKPGQAGRPDPKTGGKFEPGYQGERPGKRGTQQPPKPKK